MKTTNEDTINIKDTIDQLKKEDQRNLRTSKFFTWSSWAFIPAVAAYEFSHQHNSLGVKILIIVVFVGIALFYTLYKNSFKNIDYSKSLVETINDAVNRHKFMQPRIYLLFGIFILIDIALLMYVPNGIPETVYTPSAGHFLVVQAFLVPVFILGLGIEYFIWYKKQKPVKDALSKILKEEQ